ncbi:hypothetical protein BH24BAC1_BH24BAC1_26420 [soil metagenome]
MSSHQRLEDMEYFVRKDSVVREIWGKSDTVLFIFVGASAEFALNKAVDWLFFTGRLPADPLGRLFSTVEYARQIVFLKKEAADRAIGRMRDIHSGVEASRGRAIPDWAYRDVLFMLIDYSVRSFELLERKLTEPEKEEVYAVFYRVGFGMGIPGLPSNYRQWEVMREEHMEHHLERSPFTDELFRQYRKHLGPVRYKLLREGYVLLVPEKVNHLLGLGKFSFLTPLLGVYKGSRKLRLEGLLKSAVMPSAYKEKIKALDQAPA